MPPGLHLLDYKTNQATAANLAAERGPDEMQMYVYALAVEAASGPAAAGADAVVPASRPGIRFLVGCRGPGPGRGDHRRRCGRRRGQQPQAAVSAKLR